MASGISVVKTHRRTARIESRQKSRPYRKVARNSLLCFLSQRKRRSIKYSHLEVIWLCHNYYDAPLFLRQYIDSDNMENVIEAIWNMFEHSCRMVTNNFSSVPNIIQCKYSKRGDSDVLEPKINRQGLLIENSNIWSN